ncbi:hypothetical protein [Frondihabitans sp. 762G35]|uniref:hypothetical protein n=1 Tax=Frondihabitans sp. 762G35 TaxID=1446794 RepID=UPI000F507153|nr:hypothetical protein [Frondihabitans sp. 762G35]
MSGFDWLTQVWIPIGIAFITLLVAGVSVVIAFQSNRLAREVRRDSLERGLYTERDEFTADLEEWLSLRNREFLGRGQSKLHRDTWAKQVELTLLASQISSPGAHDLLLDVRTMYDEAPVSSISDENAVTSVLLERLARFKLRLWRKSPQEYVDWSAKQIREKAASDRSTAQWQASDKS